MRGEELKQLRELGKNFSAGKRVIRTFIDIPPISLDKDKLKRLIPKKEEDINKEIMDFDLLEFAAINSNLYLDASDTQELDLDWYKQIELDILDKKINRQEKRITSLKKRDEEYYLIENSLSKISNFLTKKSDMLEWSENRWKANMKKYNETVYFGLVMELGTIVNNLKEQRRMVQKNE